MKRSRFMTAVLGGILVGSLFCVGAAFAEGDNGTDANSSVKQGWMGKGFGMRGPGQMAPDLMGKGQENLQAVLDELVDEGTLTEEQVAEISDFCDQKVEAKQAQVEEMKNLTKEELKERLEKMKNTTPEEKKAAMSEKHKAGLLSELVDEEIITQEEADAIQEKLEEKMADQQEEMAEKRQEMTEERFDQLVDEEIISEDQADALIDLWAQKEEERMTQAEERKDMTAEERKEAVAEKKTLKDGFLKKDGGFLAEAVDEEIITQEEADAIQEYEAAAREAEREEAMDAQFEQLVEDGIISEDQADEMKAFLADKAEEQKARMEELKNMTEEERQAFFEENKTKGVNVLDQMVDEGIISQDQADQITLKMPGPAHFGQRNGASQPEEQE
ncbi:hypothetical protein [Candidatus Formimonas warabiya]|uniref:CARD domain-containing protein n=1 Tax=Formimonas warabiya TaxID=1761012 RepID=A0A3G1KPJ7_FORW1|nr:hypothetical protein [Candidatus Formimonas warabiya]ATW24392.1 hypothetical protein DCMF_05970 [Candidatus Formimonas warabiya]